MSAPGNAPPRVILAFWRQSSGEEVEFFVPFYGNYLRLMSHRGVGTPSEIARATAYRLFGVKPRSNARIFSLDGGHLAAFTLYPAEARLLSHLGMWLPPRLMELQMELILLSVVQRL